MKSHFITMVLGILLTICLSVPSAFGAEATANTGTAVSSDNALIVYYFHGKRRCTTCRYLEAYAKEALDRNFSEELKNGKVRWQVTDISTPENRHFVEDFSLVSQSVVLVSQKEGKQTGWKNLDQIWRKVRDKEEYIDYVSESIRQFTGKNG